MSAYEELRGFVLTHRECSGSRRCDVGTPTVDGYRVFVTCGCGAAFRRRVALDDADQGLLRAALMAFGIREVSG